MEEKNEYRVSFQVEIHKKGNYGDNVISKVVFSQLVPKGANPIGYLKAKMDELLEGPLADARKKVIEMETPAGINS